MGQTGSNMVKKLGSSLWGSGRSASEDSANTGFAIARYGGNPFVFTRRGSMFFDEDGDLAHEFFEEVEVNDGSCPRTAMKQKRRNLRPQGEVDLPHPRLHVDFPVVLCETPAS